MAEQDWNAWFKQRKAAHDADQATELAEARRAAAARGKAPFDYQRLLACNLPPEVTRPYGLPGSAAAASLEREYYLYHPKAMTMEEFAESLSSSAEFDGGGLDKGE